LEYDSQLEKQRDALAEVADFVETVRQDAEQDEAGYYRVVALFVATKLIEEQVGKVDTFRGSIAERMEELYGLEV
jgi:hypothetical protein